MGSPFFGGEHHHLENQELLREAVDYFTSGEPDLPTLEVGNDPRQVAGVLRNRFIIEGSDIVINEIPHVELLDLGLSGPSRYITISQLSERWPRIHIAQSPVSPHESRLLFCTAGLGTKKSDALAQRVIELWNDAQED